MKVFNRHMTELADLRTFDNLNKTDVIWSSTEAEGMEAALRSTVEATSWMDWWTFAMIFLALKPTDDARLVRRLLLAGARCQLLVAKTTSTLWANLMLKRRDVVLAKVKDAVSFESFMHLRSSKIWTGEELSLMDILDKAIEKSSKVLHDEAIRKAVTCNKPSTCGKKLHYVS